MDKAVKWIVIGLIALLAITIAFIVAATLFPDFRIISRDVAIVLLAVFGIIAFILVIVLLLGVLYAVKSIDRLTREAVLPKIDTTIVKVDEILENTRSITSSVRDSADTATTTTVFVAERVASPVIRVSSLVAGVKAAANTLAHRDSKPEQNSSA